MEASTPTFDAHRKRLLRLFSRDVMQLAASSLLDVGCGHGLLLACLARTDLRAEGIDVNERRVTACSKEGLEVQVGSAGELPFADASFDWVVIRHVLHHLDEPAVAVREAWRVARRGVILAEPTTDPSIPSQRAMSRFDAFTIELIAQSGHVHHPYLPAGELIALVPRPHGRVELRGYGELTPMPAEEALALGRKAAHGSDLTPSALARLHEFAEAAGSGALTYNGSVALFVHRSST